VPTLAPRQRLGPYEVVSSIGAGGMGEVYRARDTRLGRDVALKVLPTDLADDLSRRQRFALEARAVAALNHPNIVAVYDVGTENGIFYIVSELVDGATLRGAKFPLRKALDIGVQIAAGLAAAHAAGITHRDIKPDNILLTRDGQVKILDFGLAKVATAPTESTETEPMGTEPGMVMGTVGYMAPEQVRGQAADHRADIFSFGVILHEVLGGKRAFLGETALDTMHAILKQDPPELPETVPAGMRQIVAHCLEKDPANRFQSARDLGFALSQTGTQSGMVPAVAPRSAWPRRAWMAAAALALVALSLAAGRLVWSTPARPSWTGLLLGGADVSLNPRISPDGNTLAFQALVDGQTQVAVMKPESGDWAILTRNRTRGAVVEMSWSPNGTSIYYDRYTDVPQGIYSVPVLGGEEQLVLENAGWPEALPDGSLLIMRLNARRQQQLFRFWPETGRLQEFPLENPAVFAQARVFPDGKEAVMAGNLIGPGQDGLAPAGLHLYIVDLPSGRVRLLPTGLPDESTLYSVAVTRDGNTVLATSISGNGFRIVVVPRSGQSSARALLTLTGRPVSLDSGPDGAIYLDQFGLDSDLLRIPPQGGPVKNITSSHARSRESSVVLPDGRAIVTDLSGGRSRLLAVEAGKIPVPFVSTAEDTAGPAAMAGPREVAFLIGPAPRRTIALASVSNGRITRRIPFDKGVIKALAGTPDGQTLFCSADGVIWSVALAGGDPKKIRAGDGIAVDPSGQNLFVELIEPPKTRLVRVPLHGAAEQEIPLSGPLHLGYAFISSSAVSKDGRLLVPLVSPDAWSSPPGVVNLVTGSISRIPIDYVGDFINMGWSPDGQVIARAFPLRSTIWKFLPEGK
jgi:eukaryotic-like serine/threonine-protein kinase